MKSKIMSDTQLAIIPAINTGTVTVVYLPVKLYKIQLDIPQPWHSHHNPKILNYIAELHFFFITYFYITHLF
jgi:hypothetical protein